MLPPNTILRASVRWLDILRSSSLIQSWSIIGANSNYTDLTRTQYATAIEWLLALKLLDEGPNGVQLSSLVRSLSPEAVRRLFFERTIGLGAPAWLPDSDVLFQDRDELPFDALALADAAGLTPDVAFQSIRLVHGKIDLARRSKIGESGEIALIKVLESRWPGSTVHVAKADDGYGYDVLFRCAGKEWHLEVKTTTRRGRLLIYLSRHEHEVGLSDPNWRLVLVGLDEQLHLQALATVRNLEVLKRAPRDLTKSDRWQVASHDLAAPDLERGLSFLNMQFSDACSTESQLIQKGGLQGHHFAWLPTQ